MNSILENLANTSKSNLQALEGFTTQAQTTFEKLVELNLATGKAALTESFSHAQSVLGAKDLHQFVAIQSGTLAGLVEKSTAYAQHVQTIFTGTGAEFTKAVEAGTAETQKAFAGMLENVLKNAPAGTESAVTAFKGAFATGQKALESAQSSAKQAIELSKSNFDAATKTTTDIVKKATKAAA